MIPSSNFQYTGEFLNIAKDGAGHIFDKLAETKVSNIIAHNKAHGIRVDNLNNVRQSPRMYKDHLSRQLLGQDSWIHQGGIASGRKWTTKLSAWQDPLSNYKTPNATRWSKGAKLLSEALGIIGDVASLADVAKGGSPLSLSPIPVEMMLSSTFEEMERLHFELALNEPLNIMEKWISVKTKNNKNPFQEFYQQLRFVYTTDEQADMLHNGQLNFEDSHFSYRNDSATKATLIHVQDNNYSILKTYDLKK
jgi:hypothetical protein